MGRAGFRSAWGGFCRRRVAPVIYAGRRSLMLGSLIVLLGFVFAACARPGVLEVSSNLPVFFDEISTNLGRVAGLSANFELVDLASLLREDAGEQEEDGSDRGGHGDENTLVQCAPGYVRRNGFCVVFTPPTAPATWFLDWRVSVLGARTDAVCVCSVPAAILEVNIASELEISPAQIKLDSCGVLNNDCVGNGARLAFTLAPFPSQASASATGSKLSQLQPGDPVGTTGYVVLSSVLTGSGTPAPTTRAPTTRRPTSTSPTTAFPTRLPTTLAPTTISPTTRAPTTRAPVTAAPSTSAPTTRRPTAFPTRPTTRDPTPFPVPGNGGGRPPTVETTPEPTEMPTSEPTRSSSPTLAPTTSVPTTSPTTTQPSSAPTTSAPTSAPSTTSPSRAPVTHRPSLAPTVRATLAPVTPCATHDCNSPHGACSLVPVTLQPQCTCSLGYSGTNCRNETVLQLNDASVATVSLEWYEANPNSDALARESSLVSMLRACASFCPLLLDGVIGRCQYEPFPALLARPNPWVNVTHFAVNLNRPELKVRRLETCGAAELLMFALDRKPGSAFTSAFPVASPAEAARLARELVSEHVWVASSIAALGIHPLTGQLRFARAEITTSVSKEADADQGMALLRAWNELTASLTASLRASSPSASRRVLSEDSGIAVQAVSSLFARAETQTAVVEGIIASWITSTLIAGMAVFLHTGGDVVAALFITLIMTMCVVLVFGFGLFALRWEFGFIEAVALTVVVGLVVDPVTHLVFAFIHAPKKRNPSDASQARSEVDEEPLPQRLTLKEKASYSLGKVGPTILSAIATTLLAAVVLFGATLKPFPRFATIIVLSQLAILLLSFTCMMPLLMTFGVTKDVRRLCCKRGCCARTQGRRPLIGEARGSGFSFRSFRSKNESQDAEGRYVSRLNSTPEDAPEANRSRPTSSASNRSERGASHENRTVYV